MDRESNIKTTQKVINFYILKCFPSLKLKTISHSILGNLVIQNKRNCGVKIATIILIKLQS